MLLMGDEIRRTQLGNNNAYCQDGPISWLDWTLVERHRDLHRFAKRLIALRLGRDLAAGEHGLTLSQLLAQARIEWHGIHLGQPDWGEASRSLACTIWSMSGQSVIHLMASAYWEPLSFELPRAPGDGWLRLVDTARDAPDDVAEPGNAALVSQDHYPVQPRSVVLLLGRTAGQRPAGASPADRSSAKPA
jgi:glycogen operon protein